MKIHIKNMSIKIKLFLGFMFIFATTFVSIFIASSNSSKIIEDTDWIIHTQTVLTDVSEIETNLLCLETCQRGFIITGDSLHIKKFDTNIDLLKQNLKHLRNKTSDNASQTERIDQLKAYIELKLEKFNHSILVRQASGFTAAKEIIQSYEGMIIMDSIRAQLKKIQNEELRLLEIRSLKPVESRAKTERILLILLIFSILSTILIAIYISISIINPVNKLKKSTQIVAKGNLDHKVEIYSHDEIGELAVSFQEMILKLQTILTSRKELEKEIKYRKEIEDNLLKIKSKLETKQVELTKSNLTKDKLFSIIAHDLKSPFNALLGFSRIIYNDFDKLSPEKQKMYSQIIYKGIDEAHKLLDNLLMWTRSQRGELILEPLEYNLFDLSNETIKISELSIHEKNITLHYGIPKELKVFVDKNLYNTILRNLLSNAIKFTPQNGIITIEAKEKILFDNNSIVEIMVKDSGVGITELSKNKLFDINSKHSTLGTEKEKGSGLGLSICKEFVELSHGTIWFDSISGKGSSFYFTLPVDPFFENEY